ncbi:MAG: histidine kinase [Thermoleophilia bacterium]|nr:histidine kinase [Thermoleophilia bacterium]
MHDDEITAALQHPSRLAAIERSDGMGAAAEALDRIARLVSELLGTQRAAVSLVTDAHHVFRAQVGLTQPGEVLAPLGLEHSFCKHVVAERAPVLVEDADEDERVRGNEVAESFGVRSYLGVPVEFDGQVLGALCVFDGVPREWTDEDVRSLQDFAALITHHVDAHFVDRRADARRAEQRRRALQVNHDVLQELTTSRMALELGDAPAAAQSLHVAIDALGGILQQFVAEVSSDDSPASAIVPVTRPSAPVDGPAPDADLGRAALLSRRETEVLHLLRTGASNRSIATGLGISVDTTKKHVSSILRKLGVQSRAAAVAHASAREG